MRRLAWLLLLCLPAVAGAEDAAPSWPKDARLEVKEAALEGGLARFELTWPAARDPQGVVAYRLYRDGAIVAVLAGDAPRSFGEASARRPQRYWVQAADAAGRWSRPLSARVGGEGTLGAIGPAKKGLAMGAFVEGGIGGLGTRGATASFTPARFQAAIGAATVTGGMAEAAARVVALGLRAGLLRCGRERTADTALAGAIDVTVQADGLVTGVRPAGLEAEPEAFARCVDSMARRLRFPASGAGGEVKIPFTLSPPAE
jgi:hypothetical protein